ncbi:MAG: hypothetical protein K8J08_14540, partial [Thermoanaerobaculia bacterium]|nr:hypothetical protein [Thermoanaerobaculia bacterium]
SGTLSWPSGDGGSKTFFVPIHQDGTAEPSETVQLLLENPTGGAGIDAERGTAVLSILDDDGTPGGGGGGGGGSRGTFKLGDDVSIGIEDTGLALVAVERSQGSQGAVSVRLKSTDGSATAGLDYFPVDVVLNWGQGDSGTRIVEVALIPDQLVEGSETVNLQLSQATGGAGIDPIRGSGVLQILDDDSSTAACVPSPTTLCLQQNRFEVTIDWRTTVGDTGTGKSRPVTADSGLFWFFSENNLEMLVKVIDACDLPDFQSYWVFFAATTNTDFTLTVRDTGTGVVKEYTNPLGQSALPIQDVSTFRVCDR